MNRFRAELTRPGTNIIAEIKYSSPSHGPFACKLPPAEIAAVYRDNGAAAISVLTEEPRFHGRLEYLGMVRDIENCPPVLRKDFIRTREQIKESIDYGAAALLLIVRDLTPVLLRELILLAEEQGLEPLVEVHDPFELETAMRQGAAVIGVNNRDLRTLEVKTDTSFQIARLMEKERACTLVAESGIKERSLILELQDAGYGAFLVGGVLMDSEDPGKILRELRGEA